MAEPARIQLLSRRLNALSGPMLLRLLESFETVVQSARALGGLDQALLDDPTFLDDLAEDMLLMWEPGDGALIVPAMAGTVEEFAKAEGFAVAEWRAAFLQRGEIWARSQGSQLVTRVTEQTRLALQNLIADSFSSGESLKGAARAILEIPGIGLDAGRMSSMEKIAADLLQKYPDDRAKAMRAIQREYRRKLKSRAIAISRTEASTAGNMAIDIGYREAELTGQIDGSVFELAWLTRNFEVCPICIAFRGKRRALSGGVFISEDGMMKERPPAHPWCYCTMQTVRREAAASGIPLRIAA